MRWGRGGGRVASAERERATKCWGARDSQAERRTAVGAIPGGSNVVYQHIDFHSLLQEKDIPEKLQTKQQPSTRPAPWSELTGGRA